MRLAGGAGVAIWMLAAWVAVLICSAAADSEVSALSDVGLDTAHEFSGGQADTTSIVESALEGKGLSEEERSQVVGNQTDDAERHAIPDNVRCYWKLVEDKLAAEASNAVKKKAAQAAYDKFSTASARLTSGAKQIGELEITQSKEESELEQARNKYKSLHAEALQLFYTAKGDLNNYKNERKKVDLDAAQAKSTLGTYLKYKKSFIETAADSDDPESSGEVKHYKKLAAQYLDQYHEVQGSIKRSYSAAKQHQKLYFQLSKEYHGMTEDANDMAKQVEKLATTLGKTKSALEVHKSVHQKDTAELPGLREENDSTNATAATSQQAYDTVATQEAQAKVKYFTLSALAEQLAKMAEDAAAVSERNQLRYLDFTSKSEDKNAEVQGLTKTAMMLKKKFEAANATAAVYRKSFEFANCERVLVEADVDDMASKEEVSADASIKATVETCKNDDSIAKANEEAAKRAKTQHMDGLNHMAMVRKEHEQAVGGAKTAASVRDTAKQKAERLQNAASAVREQSSNPC